LGLAVGCALAATIPPAGAGASAGGTATPGQSTSTPSKSTSTATKKTKSTPHGVLITAVHCVPVNNCDTNAREVSTRGRLQIQGSGLASGMVVAFPRSAGAHIARNSPSAHLHNSALGLVVAVPSSAHSGDIMVLLSHGRHSNSYGPIHVARHALHPPPKPVVTSVSTAPASAVPFEGQGMWIWYVSASDGGSVASIVAQAKASDVGTLFVKSSDGSSNYWSQFSPQLVAELHANGLKVCAWQYVYGSDPVGEAELGAQAVTDGADCLVIDAEAQYEGKYGAAQTYLQTLRAKIGESYPLGLASFPYVSYHESFPYSVFLGPGGAQFNLPQMYWKDIGNSVDTVYANTYIANRIYGRPIFPLGQTYEHPSSEELVRFREEASDYGATGLSFWDFQETPSTGWEALSAPLEPLTSVTPNTTWPELSKGSSGDQVLWLQEHLASAIPTQQTTGSFASETEVNLRAFQAAHGIAESGVAEAATWQALLALPPVAVDWTGSGPSG
jgi:peptidoglycan hydrolase-like protein with peptidoglycan-binding domain